MTKRPYTPGMGHIYAPRLTCTPHPLPLGDHSLRPYQRPLSETTPGIFVTYMLCKMLLYMYGYILQYTPYILQYTQGMSPIHAARLTCSTTTPSARWMFTGSLRCSTTFLIWSISTIVLCVNSMCFKTVYSEKCF